MKRKIATFSIVFLCSFYTVFASTVKWTGLAGDGLWETSSNWSTGLLPTSTDDVVFDNLSGIANSYVVTLPASSAVTVNSITISPSVPNTINVLLPSTNSLAPALTLTKTVYSMVIGNGGSFKNSSTASSGSAIVLNDSLQILNGGTYIQNSKTGHATIVTKLSKIVGTEDGTFELDVPTTVGYTVSITGRTFGNLILSANAAGGTRTYTSTGGSALIVNGDFIINNGVTYSIDLSNNVTIHGDFIHNGKSIDLSSQANVNNTSYFITGNLSSSATSIITNTAGLPVIELNGNTDQKIDLKGAIQNTVSLKINTTTSATLQTPLALPYKFDLSKGVLNTSTTNVLTLNGACTLLCDSLSTSAYVNGPIKKLGLDATNHFIFPVGKNGLLRWVALKNVSGDFIVEYFNDDPHLITATLSPALNDISSKEYWSIDGIGSSSIANVELSFINPSSGIISDLNSMFTTQYISGTWMVTGNISTTGSAASYGSIVSNSLTAFSNTDKYFTIASATAANVLPLKLLYFNALKADGSISLKWTINKGFEAKYFDIEGSNDGVVFSKIASKPFVVGVSEYNCQLADNMANAKFYRLYVKENDRGFYSKIISFGMQDKTKLLLYPTIAKESLHVQYQSNSSKIIYCKVISLGGFAVQNFSQKITNGINNFQLNVSGFSSGKYVIQFFADGNLIKTIPFIKE